MKPSSLPILKLRTPPALPWCENRWDEILSAFQKDILLCVNEKTRKESEILGWAFNAAVFFANESPLLIPSFFRSCPIMEGLGALFFRQAGFTGPVPHGISSQKAFAETLQTPPCFLKPFLAAAENTREFWFKLAIATGITAVRHHGFPLQPDILAKNLDTNSWKVGSSPFWSLALRYLFHRLSLLAETPRSLEDDRPFLVRLVDFSYPLKDVECSVIRTHALIAWKQLEFKKQVHDPRAWARVGFEQGREFVKNDSDQYQLLVGTVGAGVVKATRNLYDQYIGQLAGQDPLEHVGKIASAWHQGLYPEASGKFSREDLIRDFYDFSFWMGMIHQKGRESETGVPPAKTDPGPRLKRIRYGPKTPAVSPAGMKRLSQLAKSDWERFIQTYGKKQQ